MQQASVLVLRTAGVVLTTRGHFSACRVFSSKDAPNEQSSVFACENNPAAEQAAGRATDTHSVGDSLSQ